MGLYSLIISTKNNQSTLRYVLSSTLALAKDYSVELIIVDGKSSDRTPEIISTFINKYGSHYADSKVLQDPGNSLSFSRLLGYKHSNGDTVIFMDGDILLSSSFAHHVEEELSDSDLVSPLFEIAPLDQATKTFNKFIKVVSYLQNTQKTKDKPSILPPARIFKRHVLKKMHGYPLSSKFFGEDRIATALAVKLGFRYKFSTRLKLLKIDEIGYFAYWKKHFRYGFGIEKDTTFLGKRLLRDYIVARRFNHLNVLIPIISTFYAKEYYKLERDLRDSMKVALMKYLIDLAMFLGDLNGF